MAHGTTTYRFTDLHSAYHYILPFTHKILSVATKRSSSSKVNICGERIQLSVVIQLVNDQQFQQKRSRLLVNDVKKEKKREEK